jgi:hypothetical protein
LEAFCTFTDVALVNVVIRAPEPEMNGPPLTLSPTSAALNNAVADVTVLDAPTVAVAAVHVASWMIRLFVYSMAATVAAQPDAPFLTDNVPLVAPAVSMKAPPVMQPPLIGRLTSAEVIAPDAYVMVVLLAVGVTDTRRAAPRCQYDAPESAAVIPVTLEVAGVTQSTFHADSAPGVFGNSPPGAPHDAFTAYAGAAINGIMPAVTTTTAATIKPNLGLRIQTSPSSKRQPNCSKSFYLQQRNIMCNRCDSHSAAKRRTQGLSGTKLPETRDDVTSNGEHV